MEKEINVADILKDKPNGTKLYADAFGELKLECVKVNKVDAIYTKNKTSTLYCFYNDGKYNKNGEPILVPSKEMRDWSKFAWKKGDVLVSNDSDSHIIFKGFSKDDYTIFEGKHWISVSKKRHISCLNMQNTQNYHIEDNKEVVQNYIKTIEERFGGKLNLETLEVEKHQLEFKDGDIVVYGKSVAICRRIYKNTLYFYVSIDETFGLLFDDNRVAEWYRFATEEEKQQLFDALAKKRKVWDSKKKQIVDLKIKWMTLKPFDRVVTRVDDDAIWTANIFSHVDQYGEYVTIGCVGGYPYCLPYNEETAKLIGTTNNWEG